MLQTFIVKIYMDEKKELEEIITLRVDERISIRKVRILLWWLCSYKHNTGQMNNSRQVCHK